MSQILKEQVNTIVQSKRPNDKESTQKQKSNDYIFKRYRYEENTMISTGSKHDKMPQYQDSHEYQPSHKSNELESYKQQLEHETNHFDVIDFGEDDDQDHTRKQPQSKQDDDQDHTQRQPQSKPTENPSTVENPFQFDEQPQTETHQNTFTQKIPNPPSTTSNLPAQKAQQFDLKPMELVDFEYNDEQQIEDSTPTDQNPDKKSYRSDNSDENSNSNTQQQMNFSPQKSTVSFSKSQISDAFMLSPDHSLDGGFSLEESVCNFVRKNNKNSTRDPNKVLEKCFLPESVGIDKYEIHKLSQNDNPFEDAVDYSNEEELKGVKIYQSPYEDIKVQIFDKDLFVSSKIPPGIILKCKLKRSKGFFSLMNPEFDLYLENGLKHLISARKNLFRNRELFYLSTQVSNFDRPVRTLMANVLHNTYWLVDAPRVIDKKKISYLDLMIEYQPLEEGSNKERGMTVLCPPTLKTYNIGLEYDIPYIDFQWFKKSISLKLYFKGSEKTNVKNSQKNFELVDSEDESDDGIKEEKDRDQSMTSPKDETGQSFVSRQKKEGGDKIDNYLYIKMQKESQNVFDVQIQHPLTPLQAMAIILTRFDAQLK